MNVPCRNVISREDLEKAIKGTNTRYKEIIFNVSACLCTESLNELHTQEVINEIVNRKKLLKDTRRKLAWDNIAVDSKMMIDKKTGEAEVDYIC